MRSSILTIATLVLGTALASVAQSQGKMGARRGHGPGMDGPPGAREGMVRTPLADALELTDTQQTLLEELRTQLRESHESLATESKAARDAVLTETQRATLEVAQSQQQPRGRRRGPRVDLDLTETQAEQLQAIREQSHEAMQALQAELQATFAETLTQEQAATLGERPIFGRRPGGMGMHHGERVNTPEQDETASTEAFAVDPGAAKTAVTATEETSWATLKKQHGSR